jgi:NAD(P)H-nitrite reductase large subunit
MEKFIVIGNSAAGFSATKTLRNSSQDIEIVVICQENYPAYQSNRLVDLFAGRAREEELFLCREDFYSSNKINFLKSFRAVRLDENKKQIILQDNQKLNYDYLIIASGRRVKLPDIPGINKQGVFAFDNLDNVKQARSRMNSADIVCVVGNSDVCLAIAQAIACQGKEVKIICGQADYQRQLSSGIDLIREAYIVQIIGEGQVKAIRLSNDKIIGTPLVLFIDGYIPRVDFLKGVSLRRREDYVWVDPVMCTSAENIFAAGGVCGSESWQEASNQGIMAAQSALERLVQVNKMGCRDVGCFT